jgi:signal transduction histidine kinase
MKHFDDSLLVLAEQWKNKNPSFTVEVFDDFFITYYYNDSKPIDSLERVRDSLIESFNKELINNKGLVPVMLIDAQTKKIVVTNIPEAKKGKTVTNELLDALNDTPITVEFQSGEKNLLYYGNSPELRQLKFFPFIQFTVIGLFALIGYLIFSTFRKAEQNQVWAGMAKETAHQLGTPLSSLMAWVQHLESMGTDAMITSEMQKDVHRLEKVTDRFSKIGSGAKLDDTDLGATVQNVMSYLKPRISDKVKITVQVDPHLTVNHNASLIEWVVENIAKNAVDAMEASGELYVSTEVDDKWVHIDIKDTGKGIPANQFKTIFQPGYSTKKRGWGLGLSLVRRIVKEYHKGKVLVLDSQVGVGTTFRISLPK